MKKEKSLNFLSSKWLMSAFLALGILFCSSSMIAQSPFTGKITKMTDLRDTFDPSSAKYDIVQEAVDYLEVLEQQYIANPNWASDLANSQNSNPLNVDKIRKTHATILAVYSPAQLAEFQQVLGEYTTGVNPNPQAAIKTQWILDANAY